MNIKQKIWKLEAMQNISDYLDSTLEWYKEYKRNEETGEYDYQLPTEGENLVKYNAMIELIKVFEKYVASL